MSEPSFQHDQADRTGVLLVNLGTPDAPDRASVRRYLKEFLWDPRVVEVPRPAWWLVLNLVILNTRPARSAKAYQKIWTEDGSPLLHISVKQAEALNQRLNSGATEEMPVVLAMRYGQPSIRSGLEELRAKGARRVLVLPLYPQYSASTTASIFDEVTNVLQEWRWLPELRFINHYHDDPAYIAALGDSVRAWQAQHGAADKLLMSFHGIPQEYFDKGDPYFCECQKTGRLLAENLHLDSAQWTLSFQSRLGPKQWLQPYTDHTLEQLARDGTGSVQVICPGFSTDCLETLEEIAMENREVFLEAGGERYEYIPCLNDTEAHMQVLEGLVQRHTANWGNTPEDPQAVRERARRLGADN